MKMILGVILFAMSMTGYARDYEKTAEQTYEWLQSYPDFIRYHNIFSCCCASTTIL